MVKISDYVMQFIADLGVEKVFYITGGGAMHLNDSLGRNESLEGVCMIHEQGASIAAEAYARVHEGYGACLVTSGPGGTNALTLFRGAPHNPGIKYIAKLNEARARKNLGIET